jgi:methionyl-tRNA formyltransferase
MVIRHKDVVMRIALCGKNDAAVDCLEFLHERSAQILAIAPVGDEGQDGWQRSFKKAADRLNLPLDQPKKINDPQYVNRLVKFAPNALISIQYDQILRQNLFTAIGCPCLNLHYALLPRHRGVAPIAWAVMLGDPQTGVTLHHMIEDIDAGDVVTQRAVPIAGDDTARDVYDNLNLAAVQLFKEHYPFSAKELATRVLQDRSKSLYHKAGEFDFSQKQIDWDRDAHDLHRWIRSMIFPPFQYPQTTLRGKILSVSRLEASIAPANPARPGTIVRVSNGRMDVAARNGVIRITEILDGTENHPEAIDKIQSIQVGDQLE